MNGQLSRGERENGAPLPEVATLGVAQGTDSTPVWANAGNAPVPAGFGGRRISLTAWAAAAIAGAAIWVLIFKLL
jgi:hypothetical protein